MRRSGPVLGVLLVGAGLVIGVLMLRGGHRNESRLLARAGRAVDVSQSKGPQSEVDIAADPSNPDTLIAGSNDIGTLHMRVYQSSDGGRSWRTGTLPLPRSGSICETSDPGVAVARTGRQFYSFLGVHCVDGHARGSSIYVESRPNARAAWRPAASAVAPGRATTLADDRPSITVDNGAQSPTRGRIYVGWSRFSFDVSSIWADPDAEEVQPVDVSALVSHSDDNGGHWSKPTVVSGQGQPLELRFATSRSGVVYAAWRDALTNSVYIARSADGMSFGAPKLIAAATVRADESCHTARARIPAQPKRCVSPNPVVTVDTSGGPRDGRVYVVWGSTSLNQSQDVYVAAFDPELHPLLGVGHVHQVNPPEPIRGPDQFLPTAAIDPRSGRLWACDYQTPAEGSTRARFTCQASDDGGQSWSTPVPATKTYSDESRPPANVDNGYGDYEAAAVTGGSLVAAWTDGRLVFSNRKEEIFAARITAREVVVKK